MYDAPDIVILLENCKCVVEIAEIDFVILYRLACYFLNAFNTEALDLELLSTLTTS